MTEMEDVTLNELVTAIDDTHLQNTVQYDLEPVYKKDSDVQEVSKALEDFDKADIEKDISKAKTKETMGKYTQVVFNRDVQPTVVYPQKEAPKPNFASQINAELSEKIENVLNKVNPKRVVGEASALVRKGMSRKEQIERAKRLAALRSAMFFDQQNARRQNKIKSKKYHRILKHEKERDKKKEQEILIEKDPELAKDFERKKEFDRLTERITQRHAKNQWAREMKEFGLTRIDGIRRDIQDKDAIGKMLREKQNKEWMFDEKKFFDEQGLNKEINEILGKENFESDDEDIGVTDKDKEIALDRVKQLQSTELDNDAIMGMKFMKEARKKEVEQLQGFVDEMNAPLKEKKDVVVVAMNEETISTGQQEGCVGIEGNEADDSKKYIETSESLAQQKKKDQMKRKEEIKKFMNDITQNDEHNDDKMELENEDEKEEEQEEASKEDQNVKSGQESVEESVQPLKEIAMEDDNKEEAEIIEEKTETVAKHKDTIQNMEMIPLDFDGNAEKEEKKTKKEKTVKMEIEKDPVATVTLTPTNPEVIQEIKMESSPLSRLQNMDEEDDNIIFEKDQKELLRLAFAEDDVMQEVNSYEPKKKKEYVPGENENLPGWGEWSNQATVTKKVNQEKKPRKKKIYVNAGVDKKFLKYLAIAAPVKGLTAEVYDKLINQPIGSEWVSAKTHSKLIAPRHIVHRGREIEPVSSDALKQKEEEDAKKKQEEQTNTENTNVEGDKQEKNSNKKDDPKNRFKSDPRRDRVGGKNFKQHSKTEVKKAPRRDRDDKKKKAPYSKK
ncbi:hypothetical protein EIN_044340 [Entamoeba invadens IP1]|uniref:U3 small nucleolar RNA-associated protein n=1 Tax=Entamoeba invadens IP1 TaxID=370355 RepID=A0A0A1U557_ENTIV|nr:hypothetical protein EIN_044340 [Entamoeba invadens IP1]ELP86876.1 hypothetical protein EIN_044340 [Entamoeba invadens IP1]|eukprot:XP_004253647.1 hypothetical protein EIN_044340 [Entamoeba invadens IP1]